MQGFEIPKIMKFTVMPYRLVARAWLDPAFEDVLIKYPKAFLLEKSSLFPRQCEYVVLRDTPGIKHFVIPYLEEDVRSLSDVDLRSILEKEVGGEGDFSEFLPVDVLARCYQDNKFKKNLVLNPHKVLADLNYILPFLPKIVENSETVFHIPLRYNNVKGDDFLTIYRSLVNSDLIIASTKCCGSGTCNDDKEEK